MVPVYIISLGFYIFVVGFFGIAISGLGNRCLLVVYALLMGIGFLGQVQIVSKYSGNSIKFGKKNSD